MRTIQSRLILVIVSVLLFPVFSSTKEPFPIVSINNGLPPEMVQSIEDYVAPKMDELRSPGLQVGIVKGTTLVYEGYYGWSDIESKKPVDEGTLFRIGSISKTFTAIGLMQQWEMGKFQLDNDVSQYLSKPLVFPPNPDTDPITFRHLLTHTSGGGEFLSYKQILMKGQGIFVEGDDYKPLDQYLRLGFRPRIDPGLKHAYCNYGFGVVGVLIEDLSGSPFHLYMKENVFGPLQMQTTTYHHNYEILTRTATGYKIKKGEYKIDSHKATGITPAGSIYTNIDEFSHYMIAILNGGQYKGTNVIKTETLEMMMDTQFTEDPRQLGYGLAFRIYGNDLWGHRMIGHGGHIPFGFTALMIFCPEEKTGVFVFSNSQERAGSEIAPALLRMVMNIQPKPLLEVEPDKSVWPELIGYYGPEYKDLKSNARIYMNNIGTYRVQLVDDELVIYGTWSGKKSAKILHQLNSDDPYFFWIENEKKKGKPNMGMPSYISFQKGDQGQTYITKGGDYKYMKFGPTRKTKAALTAPLGRVLVKINPL